MAFERPAFKEFHQLLKSDAKDPDAEVRSIAENFILEERLTEVREDNYGDHLDRHPANTKGWINAHQNYLENSIYLRKKEPETFTADNRPNLHPGLADNQVLVRMERIDRTARFIGEPVNKMMQNIEDYIADPKKDVNIFFIKRMLDKWNKKRDHRPMFAGFWGEVEDIFVDAEGNPIADDSWANRLRDRFGLGDMDPSGKEHIPVVMFWYRVSEVKADPSERTAIPTVLDGGRYEYFCPTPKKAFDTGLTLDLSEGDESDYSLNCEVLHRHMEYRSDFIYNAGWITGSPGKKLEEARRIHLEYIADDFENRL